jgi:hypothetical protein
VVNSHLLCQLSYRGLKCHQNSKNFDDIYKSLYIFSKNVNILKQPKRAKKTPEKGVTPGKGEIGGT